MRDSNLFWIGVDKAHGKSETCEVRKTELVFLPGVGLPPSPLQPVGDGWSLMHSQRVYLYSDLLPNAVATLVAYWERRI